MLNTIRCRYHDDLIYTYSGIVLTALNPYATLDIYEKEVIWAFHEQNKGCLSPHIFAIAEEAYKLLTATGSNQTIIVSGESGAGKTVSAKYLMRYLAEVCVLRSPQLVSIDSFDLGGAEKEISIEDKVLATNPILESFGNAKTLRNDNSSRFGKYIQIYFNSEFALVGAEIKTFLLEKTRVIFQAENERNFHIFHQLKAGSKDKALSLLDLDHDFNYLREDSTATNDDAHDLKITQKSLSIAGIDADVQLEIFKVLAAILHLGNIEFHDDSDFHAQIPESSNYHLNKAASLLQVERTELVSCFIRKMVHAGSEHIEAFNNAHQASSTRDAIAKLLYSGIFNLIVSKLNKSLSIQSKEGSFIGILDIYGFEKFENNSFEQLCINYANEKLQNLFNKHVFEIEQTLYSEEEIDWSYITFYDNQGCLDLIEAKYGVLDMLDEECRFPNGSDASFVRKLYEHHSLEDSFLIHKKLANEEKFTIKHFAYDVEYNASSFLEKNRDSISNDIIILLSSSKSALIEEILKVNSQEAASSRESTPSKKRDGALKSTGISFKNSLNRLLEVITSTQCHYIRCIKPNELKKPNNFESAFVVQQLQACGVLETIKISAMGYPGRWRFEEFIERFSILVPEKPEHIKEYDTREKCKVMLNSLSLDASQYQIGRTKIFLRSGVLALLEEHRLEKLMVSSLTMQTVFRSFTRKVYLSTRKGFAKEVQRLYRLALGRQMLKSMQRLEAFVSIIRYYQVYQAYKKFNRLRACRDTLLTAWRHYKRLFNCKEQLRLASMMLIKKHYLKYLGYRQLVAALKINNSLHQLLQRRASTEEFRRIKEEMNSIRVYKERNQLLEEKVKQLELADKSLAVDNPMVKSPPLAELFSLPSLQNDNNATALDHSHCLGLQRKLESEIESYKELIESLERSNNDLFEKNEELEARLKDLQNLDLTNDKLPELSKSRSLANIIIRDPDDKTKHSRMWSYDSRPTHYIKVEQSNTIFDKAPSVIISDRNILSLQVHPFSSSLDRF